MLALINAHAPSEALNTLSRYAEVVPFEMPEFPILPLAGHTDLFIFSSQNHCVVAPNLPQHYKKVLRDFHISFVEGLTPVEENIATLGSYNVACGGTMAIANSLVADNCVTDLLRNNYTLISVRQPMCRCAAIILNNNFTITSDGGIAKTLREQKKNYLEVSPQQIVLPGYRCGCFGGCCGITDKQVFLVGSLKYHPQGDMIRSAIEASKKEVVELYDGPLFDVGSIILFE